MPYNPEASSFTIVCSRSDYSAGRIAHAIEDCNAHVLNLNVTDRTFDNDDIAIEVRVDRKDISSIVRSLGRYNFNVESVADTDETLNEYQRRRIAELLRYIDI